MEAKEYIEEEKERNTQDLLTLVNEGVIPVRRKEGESREDFLKDAKMYFGNFKIVSFDKNELIHKELKLTIQQYLHDISNGFNLDKMISILSNVDEDQVHTIVKEGKITMDTYNKAIKEIMLLQIK